MIDTKTRLISGLSEIAAEYDAILCDAWGVIHNGKFVYPGVEAALTLFREQHGPVFVLTNAPRLSNVIPAQLDRLGLPRTAYDGVVTSGDATRTAIEQFDGKKAFRLGPGKDDTLFQALDISFTTLEKSDFILCTGLFDDENETPEDYREMFHQALKRQQPMICANPDIVVKFGDTIMYCGGALAQLYEQMGGETILCGKPHQPIYDLASARLNDVNHPQNPAGSAPKRVLVIGDGLGTDILGANQQGLDVLFIADGIFSDAVRDANNDLDPDRLSATLAENNCHAAYALDGLRW